ncbi:MAG: helix-turn-helix domain-containing protein [Oscillospiraceae bacterium]|jgi:DNA-binding XRE family transcriptional regulator|nr:helix-turn-helix domain-containing protein [Oscillospiraceae bacterium]
MNQYVTGSAIKALREDRGLTQDRLADRLGVSGKAVSRWETGRGYPDITLLEPLAEALGVSVIELLAGEAVTNRNRAGNLSRSRLYVCPVCGNVVHSAGSAVVSCCGVVLPPLEAEEPDGSHAILAEPVEDEWFVSIGHPMTKEHYISFLAWVSTDRLELVKLYPEGPAAARLRCRGMGRLYAYCSRHGLFSIKI